MPEPLSRCGACGQIDDHPKHMILVGFNNEHTSGAFFHEHDEDRDGVIRYHFDCPTPWHAAVTDPVHQGAVAAAISGVHGDDLRARIAELHARHHGGDQ